MSGTCDILDTTVGGQEHTLSEQETETRFKLAAAFILPVSQMEAEGWLLESCFSSETEGFLQTDQQHNTEGDFSFTSV